ncbi:hypothetical protein V5799_028094 [Amblyomma americanum]|uniref:Uncharacterized protein n=1 Tax=Amblyomma americanum TaxID=6943 RepID=A0AAQ4DDU9_AMBAM
MQSVWTLKAPRQRQHTTLAPASCGRHLRPDLTGGNRYCGCTAGVKLLSGKCKIFEFVRKDACYDTRGLQLDCTANFVY